MTHDLIAGYWYIGAGFVGGCTFMWLFGIWYGRRVLLAAAKAPRWPRRKGRA